MQNMFSLECKCTLKHSSFIKCATSPRRQKALEKLRLLRHRTNTQCVPTTRVFLRLCTEQLEKRSLDDVTDYSLGSHSRQKPPYGLVTMPVLLPSYRSLALKVFSCVYV